MKAIIIDDEKFARETLAVHLRSYCPQIDLKGEAENGREGLQLFKDKRPDIVFLDVEMPDLTGFEVLERIGPTNAAVVFVTGHDKYAEMAFEFCALDFLRKPVEPTRLVKAVHRASERHKILNSQAQYQMLLEIVNQQNAPVDLRDQRIAFSTQTEVVYSWLRNIVHIRAEGNMSYIRLVEHPKPLFIARSIGVYEKQFLDAKSAFLMRVHKSHLINLYHVKKYIRTDNAFLMSDGEKVTLSENFKEQAFAGLSSLGLVE